MLEKITHRFYDSHPELPFDPDTDQDKAIRPIHTDPVHMLIVAVGAFFGTLARYEIGTLLPTKHDDWPLATFLINISGAFVLGLLLESLASRGKDEGGRRVVRLLIGTGFCGGYTTYSSLATSAALLVRDNHLLASITYIAVSIVCGIIAAALGIQVAARKWSDS